MTSIEVSSSAPVLSEEPPVWVKVTSRSEPDELVTGFRNWSMSSTRAVMNRAFPRGGAGLTAQLNESPTVPVQVTSAGALPWPLPTEASVKLRPAARAAVTVSVWVPDATPALAAVMTGWPARSSP